jgi:transcription elongation factor SPT5
MLEGRTVTIKKGAFRGMRGRIISATSTHVRLELEAQMKTVTVDRWAAGQALQGAGLPTM